MHTGSSARVKLPCASVVTVRVRPVSVQTAETFTPGRTAPVASVIAPVMFPAVRCAEAGATTSSVAAAARIERDTDCWHRIGALPFQMHAATRRSVCGCNVRPDLCQQDLHVIYTFRPAAAVRESGQFSSQIRDEW